MKTEILGFTTRAWKGGQSRDQWLAQRASAMEPEQEKTVATNDANAPSRIVLPDDDRAL